jgi:hypothetical protein
MIRLNVRGTRALLWVVVGASGFASGPARATVYGADYGIYGNPGRLVGPDAHLRFKNNVLTGQLAGGAYQVEIGADRARGTGPMGPIDLRLTRLPTGYDVEGIWNGGTVHFLVGDRSITGKAMRRVSAGSIGQMVCNYDLVRGQNGAGFSGVARCLGRREATRFELQPRLPTGLTEPQNVILLVAYLTAPAATR